MSYRMAVSRMSTEDLKSLGRSVAEELTQRLYQTVPATWEVSEEEPYHPANELLRTRQSNTTLPTGISMIITPSHTEQFYQWPIGVES